MDRLLGFFLKGTAENSWFYCVLQKSKWGVTLQYQHRPCCIMWFIQWSEKIEIPRASQKYLWLHFGWLETNSYIILRGVKVERFGQLKPYINWNYMKDKKSNTIVDVHRYERQEILHDCVCTAIWTTRNPTRLWMYSGIVSIVSKG